MASKKSREKSRKGEKMPGRNGGTLIAGKGRGPAKGQANAGRPRDEWKARLAAMVSREEVFAHVEATLLQGPSHPFFQRALDYATDHGYGRATQPIELSGTVSIADQIQAARDRARGRTES